LLRSFYLRMSPHNQKNACGDEHRLICRGNPITKNEGPSLLLVPCPACPVVPLVPQRLGQNLIVEPNKVTRTTGGARLDNERWWDNDLIKKYVDSRKSSYLDSRHPFCAVRRRHPNALNFSNVPARQVCGNGRSSIAWRAIQCNMSRRCNDAAGEGLAAFNAESLAFSERR
jgi:hypothetical protein